ncbi:MAG: NAD(P)H-hydrate epimerase [Candidatus Omnitrophota bacterium]
MDTVTSSRMRHIDRDAICFFGMPSLILMENAGMAVAEAVLRRVKKISTTPPVSIFCGKGNNGGDGMVCARYISNAGIAPKLYIIGGISSLKGDSAIQLKVLDSFSIKWSEIKDKNSLSGLRKSFKAGVIVDAIFGIGFSGQADGIYKDIIDMINSKKGYKISVDVPSGLDATKGVVKGSCVKADETVTMGFAKTGFYKNDGPEYTGKIKVADIGLPKRL